MTIRKLGLMALALAVLLPFGVFAEDALDEGWDEDTSVYDWEVRDGTFFVEEGVEYLGYLASDDEEQYGLLTSFDLSYELDAFHFDPDDLPEAFDKLQLPSSLRIVGEYAFYHIYFFEEIILPEGVAEMHSGCMEFCGAKRVFLPSTVHLVEPGAFIDAYNLETIDVSPDNPWYTSVDGVLYTKDKTTLVAYPPGRDDTHIDVPAGVKEIGALAFCDDWSLHSVSLPFGVERIGRAAFSGCVHLETVTLPPTLREIELRAFADCVLLERINPPRQVVALDEGEEISEYLVFANTPMLKDCWMKEPLPQEDEQAPGTHEDNWQYTFDHVELYGIVNPENARDMVSVVDSIYDGKVIASLACGTSVKVTGVGAEWYRVKLLDWAEGYIPANMLLVRRSWEPLYRIQSVTTAHDNVNFWPTNDGAIPGDMEQVSLPNGKDISRCLGIRGSLVVCYIPDSFGSHVGCFNPMDVNLTRYDNGDGKTYGMVISDDLRNRLNLRQAPDKDSASLGKYFSGAQVEILAEEGDWYKVRVDFQEGWMMKQYVRIVPVEPEETAEE